MGLPIPPPPPPVPPAAATFGAGGRSRGIDPKHLRPHRWWYWLAGALLAVGLVGGTVVGARAVAGLIQVSELQQFRLGEEVDVELQPEAPMSIYVRQDDPDTVPVVDCVGTAPGPDRASIELTQTDLTTTLLHDGDLWVAEYDVEVTRPGRFTIECRGFGGLDLTLGLGPRSDPMAALGRYRGPGLLATAASGAGVVIGLVVLLRRSGHKRRLVAERVTYSPR